MTHPGIPMLALAPGQAPGTGAGTGYDVPPPPFRRLDAAASAFDRARDGWLITRVTAVRPATAVDPGLQEVTFPASAIRLDAYDAWLSHVWTASACSRPVLLRGSVRYVDPATGEVTGTIRTDDLPDHVIYKPCGNRRATTCPGCAETYRRDAFHLIRAGLAGGKGVPESVAGHPLVFATFTAPSFGPVHSRPVRRHTCAGKQHCNCKAEPCHPRRNAGKCPHGRPLACYRRHSPGDPRLGDAAVHGLLRLPRPRRVERRRRGTVAAHQAGHRTPPHPARRPPRHPLARRIPAPGPPAARQGRRVPGPRSRPLPRPAPPRRHQPQRPRRDHHAPARHHRSRPPGRHPPGRRHRLFPHPSSPRQP